MFGTQLLITGAIGIVAIGAAIYASVFYLVKGARSHPHK